MRRSPAFEALPLRQRKHALTKIGLLDAMLAAIRTRAVEEVKVADLCAASGISEASFFNYFPKKHDILTYYVQLWSIEMSWHAQRLSREGGGLAAIEGIFAIAAREAAAQPGLMAEIVAGQARMTSAPVFEEISVAERLLRFPDHEGVEGIAGRGLDELLPPLIDDAIRNEELPASTDPKEVLLMVATIFLGLPVVLRGANARGLEAAYARHLSTLWAGLRAARGRRRA